ncbi:MAG: hypothetical protein HYT08_03735 [Candidatus Levybacteria bacterium]|nr:hypothetical protein [Candidatus Levybacteria bacterium]
MNYLIFIVYVATLLLVLAITIYNILFTFYSEKAKNELAISLPSFFNKLLTVNIFLALLTLLFILYQILKNL